MKTARLLVLVTCVFCTQIAFGQYQDGVPPVYSPQALKGYDISSLDSNYLTKTVVNPVTKPVTRNTAVESAVQVGSTRGACCDGSCNEFGLLCNSRNNGPCCADNRRVGRSFFRGSGCGSGCNSGSAKFKFSVNRGPQTCDQCGADNRTLLQRVLPISINIRSNHESRYTGVFGGYHNMQDIRAADRLLDFNDSFILGFTRGRRFCDRIRMEAEFAIRDAPAGEYFEGAFVGEDFVPTATYDGEDGFTAFTSMRNVLIDFNSVGTQVKPYAGLGLGGVFVTGDYINNDIGRADWINDFTFAYQFILGLTRKFNGNSEGYVEFRHFGTSGLRLENDAGDPNTDFAFQNNTIVFGMRFDRPARTCCGN